jgi:GNAT superfamily N-acetyltransferase
MKGSENRVFRFAVEKNAMDGIFRGPLHIGRHLYVEDPVTSSEARSKGLGRQMIRWLRDQARAAGCAYLDLDSGTQGGGAHRFYFRHGVTIASYHFSEKLVS